MTELGSAALLNNIVQLELGLVACFNDCFSAAIPGLYLPETAGKKYLSHSKRKIFLNTVYYSLSEFASFSIKFCV
jgi:hypothetical protein